MVVPKACYEIPLMHAMEWLLQKWEYLKILKLTLGMYVSTRKERKRAIAG